MNDETARQGRLATITIRCTKCNARPLRIYGGQRAARCPQCGHVSPSRELLRRHLIRDCCGLFARAA